MKSSDTEKERERNGRGKEEKREEGRNSRRDGKREKKVGERIFTIADSGLGQAWKRNSILVFHNEHVGGRGPST